MAKKGRKGRFRRYIRGVIATELSFGAIGAKAANIQAYPDTVIERTFVSSQVASYALDNFTLPLAGAGPVLCGLSHSDYTVAEIEEYIENVDSWNEGDLRAQEVGSRKIRIIGMFDMPIDAQHVSRLKDGNLIKTKLGWVLTTGQTLNAWVYNAGTASFSGTTTAVMNVRGHVNLWPL